MTHAMLEEIVRHIGHLLPAQGPISVFIHHNTLHAFESLSFEDAVAEASELCGCEPYLSEERYRHELQRGRIDEADLVAKLRLELGSRADERVVGELSRTELRRRILIHGIPEPSGPALRWTLEETDACRETADTKALWDACRRLGSPERVPRSSAPRRHRDLLMHGFDIDIDEWVHPILVRFTSAFLDQGLADWPMPRRQDGLYPCFTKLYGHRLARIHRPIGVELQRIVAADAKRNHDAWSSLELSLEDLGVPTSEWQHFLLAESLALRGFAGMVHQYELRPDRVPSTPVPARLVDHLATRMLVVRAALAHAASVVGFDGELAAFRDWLHRRLPSPSLPTPDERAWPVFHVAKLADLAPDDVALEVDSIERELLDFDALARRRTLHRAYERHLRHRFFDALSQHRPDPSDESPDYQAIFCIDDREESIRRHLEEVDRRAETFGVAGFFGVAMYYRGATDAHPRPLCPVAVRPRHHVVEHRRARSPRLDRLVEAWSRARAVADEQVHVGGRHARSGAFIFATIGVLWVIPLVLGVVFPWLRPFFARLARVNAAGTLDLESFSLDEMADIVFSQLAPIGIRQRFAPLVLVFGHGSSGLNNPHGSAYDCGACGGGHGGPNARAFAQMANDTRVRERLARRGMTIPDGTWFVGGERNTTSNALTLFDEDRVPESGRAVLDRAKRSLDEARRRESHERARRFESAALWLPPAATLVHVETRANDLAQPRPECGHATNAFCFVGRRRATRGLFLDRRAFLVSYDGADDADGALLAKLLSGVVPVVAGINLEYYFSYVDSAGFGAGSKLPHNITALVGVMDGAQSDLRTGLPWQMVDIHEPVRLSIVVEADVLVVQRALEADADLKRLVDHRWLYLAAIDRASGRITELDSRSSAPYSPEHPLRATHGGSRQCYEGRRGHLPFVATVLGPSVAEPAP